MQPFSFATIEQILYELGATARLPEFSRERGARRGLVVTATVLRA